jgi:nucleotide-binding universal stress UspA family protein
VPNRHCCGSRFSCKAAIFFAQETAGISQWMRSDLSQLERFSGMKTDTLTITRPKRPAARHACLTGAKSGHLRIKNVLVPVDFSAESHAAIQLALPLLRRFGANLHLAHVMPADSISGLTEMPIVIPETEVVRRVRRDLNAIAGKNDVKLRRCSFHARKGNPFKQICQLAREMPADLIVISTRGNTGLKHLALGSTAERVVRYSPCPVLVVRCGAENGAGSNGNSRRDGRFSKILVPIDFSACSMKGLAYARQLAKEFNASLVLFHAVHLQYYVASDEYARYDLPLLTQQSEKAARKQMRDLVEKIDWKGIKVESLLQIGHAGDQICGRAQNCRADLIVTSTHGTTGLKHILLGSTAEYVVRHAACPVLVVPNHARPKFSSRRRNHYETRSHRSCCNACNGKFGCSRSG